jgi:hypothetical protein
MGDPLKRVFVIAIFCQRRDPTADELLTPLVDELLDLFETSWEGVVVEVVLFTADLPAMSKIRCAAKPVGYCACYKCTIYGTRNEKTAYLPADADEAVARTDSDFRSCKIRKHHEKRPFTQQEKESRRSERQTQRSSGLPMDKSDNDGVIVMSPLTSESLVIFSKITVNGNSEYLVNVK